MPASLILSSIPFSQAPQSPFPPRFIQSLLVCRWNTKYPDPFSKNTWHKGTPLKAICSISSRFPGPWVTRTRLERLPENIWSNPLKQQSGALGCRMQDPQKKKKKGKKNDPHKSHHLKPPQTRTLSTKKHGQLEEWIFAQLHQFHPKQGSRVYTLKL